MQRHDFTMAEPFIGVSLTSQGRAEKYLAEPMGLCPPAHDKVSCPVDPAGTMGGLHKRSVDVDEMGMDIAGVHTGHYPSLSRFGHFGHKASVRRSPSLGCRLSKAPPIGRPSSAAPAWTVPNRARQVHGPDQHTVPEGRRHRDERLPPRRHVRLTLASSEA
jgi:hypothetical protein